MKRLKLGINIDHIVTLRQARGTKYPDPVEAAIIAQSAGADGITLHLREDRRHIQNQDVILLKQILQVPMNFEMALSPEIVEFALQILPEHVCLVPEKREELTTENGLNLLDNYNAVANVIRELKSKNIKVSLFIDPDQETIDAAKSLGADAIELHTGLYADAKNSVEACQELNRIRQAAEYAAKLYLIVNAGHGLNYHNVMPIAAISVLNELNIGHAIMAQAFFSGLKEAVLQMQRLMREARNVFID